MAWLKDVLALKNSYLFMIIIAQTGIETNLSRNQRDLPIFRLMI
uniref:Uncharacterized protein n=1 Tax=Candidatus Kentrum sp. LFY TaxID=2126342 RepID=A0A450U897_9GAMM|nr:MAG: hypothetical protein BECKLFY1418A_GA0070994_100346 [Candidatus Kentron sp. LFY]VFK15942.1 MAG: hypothetical protein BECKLFY1418C_GA0070996_101913 [Candidatus Kentron sp. LFY]